MTRRTAEYEWQAARWQDKVLMTLFGSPYPAEESKRLRQSGSADYSSIFTSWSELQWTIEIYMGMFFKMDMILDTASDWLLVEGAACTNCNGNTYDI